MSERSPRYYHVLRYKRTLKRWKNANLGEGVCHRLAVIEARKAFPPEHQELNHYALKVHRLYSD
jgi:hypothetical protein